LRRTQESTAFADELELNNASGLGDMIKRLKEIKKQNDYDNNNLMNFYDVKKGTRTQVKDEVKESLSAAYSFVFRNKSKEENFLVEEPSP